MHLTQGTFSYLPDFTDDQVRAQIQYALDKQWPISIEYSDDPHPRNVYWEMYGPPLFDETDASAVLATLTGARAAFPNYYIKVNAYDRSLGRQTTALSFIVNRPARELGFALERTASADRMQRYTLRSYALDQPEGERYAKR